MLVIRADGNREIGAGHISRCCAIALEAQALGSEVLFAVSDNASAEMVRAKGFEAHVLPADPLQLSAPDAEVLAELAARVNARSVLVDTYAAGSGFFDALHVALSANATTLAYLDDLYTFESGHLAAPAAVAADVVVNYGFACSLDEYRAVYAPDVHTLLIGPRYAPVRDSFKSRVWHMREHIERVLLTMGSTNPQGAIERAVCACRAVLSEPELVVAAAASTDIDEAVLVRADVELVRGCADLSDLMCGSDMAVASAGVTLYELAAIGVPTIAVPVVENQLANMRGWDALGFGPVVTSLAWHEDDLVPAIARLAESAQLRETFSARLRALVDGAGARRVAEVLL